MYGYCPICGAEGAIRERRMDGDDYCENGHRYPSKDALKDKPINMGNQHYYCTDEVYCAWYKCPSCEDSMIFPTARYCPNCGVRLLWEGDG